jgi:hypothetical protein
MGLFVTWVALLQFAPRLSPMCIWRSGVWHRYPLVFFSFLFFFRQPSTPRWVSFCKLLFFFYFFHFASPGGSITIAGCHVYCRKYCELWSRNEAVCSGRTCLSNCPQSHFRYHETYRIWFSALMLSQKRFTWTLATDRVSHWQVRQTASGRSGFWLGNCSCPRNWPKGQIMAERLTLSTDLAAAERIYPRHDYI